jgi:GcrA cell cycle regulator
MAPTEFHEALGTLGIAQQRVAALFDVSPRAVRRWRDGERRVPHGVRILVRLLADGVVTVEQVERAAVARTNGGSKSEPSAPLLFEPTSEPSTNLAESAREPSAILAGSVTTAEKVAALTATSCRWPWGDPLHSDFRFCGSPVTAPPYCEEHRAAAYLVPPPLWVRRRGRRLYTSARGIAWAG